ncbi:hypothetical protein LCGC14_1709470 [marine sediment metagenome]|uniref:Uncharacterized protein n=1 Tax=marine sediment metagenome TaxID=412755 RepID=A0A0F9JW49_9ZZZZ
MVNQNETKEKMTAHDMIGKAIQLEKLASMNDRYARAMEQTTVKTAGRLGHENAPGQYMAHVHSATDKRHQAQGLRAKAAQLDV